MSKRRESPLRFDEAVNGAANAAEDEIPVRDECVGHVHYQLCHSGQVSTEAFEQLRELRDNEDHQNCGHYEGHDQDRGRVEQRFLDLALDRFSLLFVSGDLVHQVFENTGGLTSSYQVDVQVVEL